MASQSMSKNQNTKFTYQQSKKIIQRLSDLKAKTAFECQKINPQQQVSQDQIKIFLIMGNRGSGKTVVQYYLSDQQSNLHYQMDQKTMIPYIIPKNVVQNARVQKISIQITTRKPFFRVKNQKETNKKIVYLQIPDRQEIDEDQRIICLSFLRFLFKNFNNLHILLVLQNDTLSEYEDIIKNVQMITSLFQIKNQNQKSSSSYQVPEDSYQIFKRISFILNKIPQEQAEDIIPRLEQVNEDLIQQQNKIVYQLIKKVLQQNRYFMIKQQQPNIEQQIEESKNIVEMCQTGSLKQIKLGFLQLIELIDNKQVIQNIIEQLKLKQKWQQYIFQLRVIVQYLVSPSSKRQEMFSTLSQLIKNYFQRQGLSLIAKNQFIFESQKDQKVKQFIGKINKQIKAALKLFFQKFKKPQNQRQIQNQEQLKKPSLKDIQAELVEVKKVIQNVLKIEKIVKKDEILLRRQISQQPDKQKQQVTKVSEYQFFYYNILNSMIVNILLEIDFITKILNFNIQIQQKSSSKQQQQLKDNQLYQFLIQTAYEQLKKMDIQTLFKKRETTKGTGKGKKKVKVVNKIKIVFRPATLQQLRNEQMKSIPQEVSSLQYSLKIQNDSPYKLWLLSQCLEPLISNKKKSNEKSNQRQNQKQIKSQQLIKKNWKSIVLIVKQIAKILDLYKLYEYQILFLVFISNLNSVQDIIYKLSRKISNGIKKTEQRKKLLEILNYLSLYFVCMKRNKFNQLVKGLMELLRQQKELTGLQFNQRLSDQQVYDWIRQRVIELCKKPQQPKEQKTKPVLSKDAKKNEQKKVVYAQIVQMTLQKQQENNSNKQKNDETIQMFNQFKFLVEYDFSKGKQNKIK